MSQPRQADLEALLEALLAAEVEFIIVGGTAAVLHGALQMTQDVDIVHRRSPENVARLAELLERLHACFRQPGGRQQTPTLQQLVAGGQLNLLTDLGPLDVLGRLHDGRGFDELLPHSEAVTDGVRSFRIIDLPTLIEIKATAGRTRDKLVLPMLLALLREREGDPTEGDA